MPIRSLLLIATLLLTLGASTAQAGRYYGRSYYRPYRPHTHVGVLVYPRGLYVGAGLTASRVLHQEGGDELIGDGAGLSLFSGLRVNDRLALEAGWIGTVHGADGATFDEADYLVLHGFTADARVYWQTASESLEPYVQGGLGLYLLDNAYLGTQSVGTGFQLGLGFDFLLSSSVKLGLRALYRGMAMGPPETGYADTYVGALTAEGNLAIQF